MNVKRIIKNLSASIMANGINMALSILLVLIVPKILGVREYSYWQLYTFYTTYIGFFHFGVVDGIYLKFGGADYKKLDKNYFNRQFWILVLIEFIVFMIILLCSLYFVDNVDKQFILSMTGFACLLYLPRVLLQYILQATNRIVEYANNQILEKVLYAILVITLLLLGVKDYKALIASDMISKGVTLILLVYICRDFIFLGFHNIRLAINEAISNATIGIKLLFSNIASMLITGIVRFSIENQWSVEVFGKLSLTMTASNLLMIFIGAVSVIIYPVLRKVSRDNMPKIYEALRCMLMIPVFGLLLIYYPAKVCLTVWLPQYAESLKYMALLFPICVFESKMSMLGTTYLKALRKEKQIMYINIVAMIVTGILSLLLAFTFHNLTLTVLILPIMLAFRSVCGELIVMREIRINVFKDIVLEIGLATIFVVFSWNIQSFFSTLIYMITYILYLLIKKEDIRHALNNFRDILKGSSV